MIEFRNVTKYFPLPQGRKTVIDNLTLTLPSGSKLGVLGRNGAGKSTLLSMIGGTTKPNRGEIIRHTSISWPLGFRGTFHPDLTGRQNVRFAARIYGVDTDALVDFVADFAEIGPFMDMPVRTYSSGMGARLAFGMSMGVAFDWYLVDEITSVGDTRFRRKSLQVFRNKLKNAGLLMVSHNAKTIRDYCNCGLVIENGQAEFFDDVDKAIAVHEANMRRA